MDAKWQTISALDLQTVKEKIKHKKGWWWRMWRDPDKLEMEYRQFLYLIVTNPGKTVVPWSQDVDDFWHEHILDTDKYARDCRAISGDFIHHNPNIPVGTAKRRMAFVKTKELYRKAFNKRARQGTRSSDRGAGCAANMPVIFCAGHTTHGTADHGGHHDAGNPGGGHDGGHGCSGHGGGHGCGGHGCGGHGCGGGH